MLYDTKQRRKPLIFVKGETLCHVPLYSSIERNLYTFSCIIPKTRLSASFAVRRISSLLFAIHALIYLEGHSHEARTPLNIPVCIWPWSQTFLVLRGCRILSQPLGCHRGAKEGALENHQNPSDFYLLFLSAVTVQNR